jgi:hypothetical protein
VPDADAITENPDFYQHAHRLMTRLRAESPAHRAGWAQRVRVRTLPR